MGRLVIKEIDSKEFRDKLEQQYKNGGITLDEVMETAANSAVMAKHLSSENSFEMFYIED